MTDAQLILARLRTERYARRLTTIAALVGLSTERTRQALRELLTTGEVVYNGRGAYKAGR